MNSIMTLKVYKYGAMWAFDDEARGLLREPFIAGMDKIIDKVVGGIPYAALGFNMTFSPRFFPGATTVLEHEFEEDGGNWYEVSKGVAAGMRGWLCPALYKYFTTAPRRIYIQVDGIPRGAGR